MLSASSALLKLLTEGVPEPQEPQPESKAPAAPTTPPTADKNVSQTSGAADEISETTRAEATK